MREKFGAKRGKLTFTEARSKRASRIMKIKRAARSKFPILLQAQDDWLLGQLLKSNFKRAKRAQTKKSRSGGESDSQGREETPGRAEDSQVAGGSNDLRAPGESEGGSGGCSESNCAS